jgi:hypothetical protein
VGSMGMRRVAIPRIVVPFARELAEGLQRLLELFDPVHQDGRVVPGDSSQIGHVADTVDARLQQVLKRPVVFLEPELAEAEKRVGGAVRRGQAGDLAESFLAVREVILRVIPRAQIPVAFDVVRLDLDHFGVERDRLIPSLGLACVGRRFQKLIEFGR